jgi:serine protease
MRFCLVGLVFAAIGSGCKTRTFSDNPNASQNKSFVTYRTNPGFEGFALLTKATPMKSSDVIYRDLMKDALPKVEKVASERFPEILAGLQWRVEPLGDRMTEFILVPTEEIDFAQGNAATMTKALIGLKIPHVFDVVPLYTNTADAFTRSIEAAEELVLENLGVVKSSDPEWSLKRTRTLEAHAFLKQSRGEDPGHGVVIGLIDTGITNHPELVGTAENPNKALNLADARNFLKFNNDVNNYLRFWGPLLNPNHGTSTASMLVSQPGKQNSGEKRDAWITGAAWGATLIPTKVSNSVVTAVGWRMAAAMGHLVDKGAKIISVSMGGVPTPFMHKAVQNAVGQGAIVFAAAGTGVPFVVHPAKYPEVVGVASVGMDCRQDPQSARGPSVDISAPGTNAWIAWSLANTDNSGFLFTSKQAWGTSLATPQVAGAAALWLQHHGWENLAKKYGKENIYKVFKYALKKSADTKGDCSKLAAAGYGAGVLDTMALLKQELPANASDLNVL